MGDFNAKEGTKNGGERVTGHFLITTRNRRGDQLAAFAERNRLRVMNTFLPEKNAEKMDLELPYWKEIQIAKDVIVRNILKFLE